MSSFGSTTTKDPDEVLTDDDIQMLSLDEMRGMYKDMHKAKLSLNQKATVEGCLVEIQVLKQQLEMTHEQLRRLIGMYSTLQQDFTQFKQQRVKELNVRVNGGSTTPEDMDGSQS